MDTKKDGTFFTWANQWPGRSRAQLQKRYQSSKFSLIEERTTLQEYGVFFCFLNVLSTTCCCCCTCCLVVLEHCWGVELLLTLSFVVIFCCMMLYVTTIPPVTVGEQKPAKKMMPSSGTERQSSPGTTDRYVHSPTPRLQIYSPTRIKIRSGSRTATTTRIIRITRKKRHQGK